MDPIFTYRWFGLEAAANFWLGLRRGPRSPADWNLIIPSPHGACIADFVPREFLVS